MRLLAYIPARSGSKSVPGKNIKPIKNIPLLAFSVWAAQQAGVFDDILVSTDDPAYLETVEPLGISGDYLRPSELAEDASPTIDGMHHALDWFEAQGKEFDAVMILLTTVGKTGTSTWPCKRKSSIKAAIAFVFSFNSMTGSNMVGCFDEVTYLETIGMLSNTAIQIHDWMARRTR